MILTKERIEQILADNSWRVTQLNKIFQESFSTGSIKREIIIGVFPLQNFDTDVVSYMMEHFGITPSQEQERSEYETEIEKLKEKIQELEEENKELKDTIESAADELESIKSSIESDIDEVISELRN